MNVWIFKTFMDMVRMNPTDYGRQFSINFACSTYRLPPLIWNSQLNESSLIQVQYLKDSECPFSHMTCSKYCSLYLDCSLEARVLYYCPSCQYIAENIMKGVSHPLRSLQFFLEKEGHCENIFSLDHNQVGIAFHSEPTIYVQTFAYIPKSFLYNPLVSGCHVMENETHISFFLNSFEIDVPHLIFPCSSSFYMKFPLSLFLNPNSYSIVLSMNQTCPTYYFQTLHFRYPESYNLRLDF